MEKNSDQTEFLEGQSSQMRRGLLVYSVLLLCASRKIYSSEIIERLQRADLIVVEGTLYPLLSRLARDGLLAYEWQESEQGPPRKYYWLSKTGQPVLNALQKQHRELIRSITQLEKGSK